MRELAQTGEIRKEYERELSKVQQERAEQELASEKLIQEILAQDEKELAAFRVANKENKPAASRSQPIRLPLPQRSSSIDSITGEFSRYFKPIARYPRTPPRPEAKDKGYPETIKVTPCPQTVKRLDFASSCSPPDATKPIAESSSSQSNTKTSSNSHKVKSSAADHTFLLPLQTIVDDQSNDGLSLVSASTDTSLSNSRLRIGTTSPIIPTFTPGTYSSRPSTGRSEAMSDTISYRSDMSSPDDKRRKRVYVKKNGYLNNKSSRGITNGQRITRSRAKSSACSSANGSRPSSSSRLKNGVGSLHRTRCAVSTSAVSASSNEGESIDTSEVLTNGHSLEPAFIDPDEKYAKELQDVFNKEKKYKLTALRYSGSGNEYNTRKRAKTTNH